MTQPILETARLILRPFRVDDFDAVAAYWGDPAVARWTRGGQPISRSQAWLRLIEHPGHWALMHYGFWAVEEKSSGTMIGEVGFIDLKRDYDPAVNDVPEIGWVLSPQAQGKGYATEAAKACLPWGREHLGPIRVIAAVNADNRASIRVAEKCGFRECLRREYERGVAVFLDRVL
ncbi:GNAT family N-acetyltransferase [Rhizomicrobium electricum]|jgi:RimJ/RimL family protein N-acetyltransferase|uniref:GNAT family N-acetyltransferase n=1 Tax=Rhizomicrobium electricum TaxID=480070 RepID=A0ABP3Q3E8_9PROT|nr:GNAT family N-acetyltransferase [Rhizomicrobium electricum]NIJ49794.1 RimJ/RimL family protein N-acetyltransferase [Rhizomicrobium electricum]